MRRYILGGLLVVGGVLIGMFVMSRWNGGGNTGQNFPGSDTPRETVVLGRPDYTPRELPEIGNINRVFRGVAADVKPTVVYITVLSGETIEIPLDQNHQDVWPFNQQQRQYQESSAGSGVLLSSEGYIVTNNHVINGATSIRVMLEDRREFTAEVIGTDPSTDLAVIRIPEHDDLPVIAVGDSDKLEVGEWVLAIGSPFRLTSTVTAGIVSALGRQINIIEDQFGIEDFIQTDAAINPGNSGGALVNLNGELIGISTAIATDTGSYEGYGFAVPVNLVLRVVQDLIGYGQVRRGYLGVQIQTVSASQASELGMDRARGVILNAVYPNSAATASGLREGDVLLEINGREVNASNELQRLVALYRPGDKLDVLVWRKGQETTIPVTLRPREESSFDLAAANRRRTPPDIPPLFHDDLPRMQRRLDSLAVDFKEWGIGPRELTERERIAYSVESGVYVNTIRAGSPAAADGLPAGSVITGVEGRRIGSIQELMVAIDAASDQDNVLFEVRRADGKTAYYDVRRPDR